MSSAVLVYMNGSQRSFQPWVALWLHADDAQALHDSLAADGVPITVAPFDSPFDSPFGLTFTFTDPDGYAITIHDRA